MQTRKPQPISLPGQRERIGRRVRSRCALRRKGAVRLGELLPAIVRRLRVTD